MLPAHWLQPDWPAPPGVRACFTTRGAGAADGASCGAYGHFNLGEHVGDAPQAVSANRQRLRQALQGAQPVFMQQVHGTQVLRLQAGMADGQVADAALSTCPQLACTVMVADCLPVLLAAANGRAVAAAHAGWRGLAAGVLERTVAALRQAASVCEGEGEGEPAAVLAWLGPCIGPQAFEVGGEVRQAFMQHNPDAAQCFVTQPAGKYLANLPALARQRLAALGGVQVFGNDGSARWCTVQQAGRYYSHRRDAGISGRMAACIWLQA